MVGHHCPRALQHNPEPVVYRPTDTASAFAKPVRIRWRSACDLETRSFGTTGIGAATARLFQSEETKVVVTGSSAKTVEAARPTLPGVEVVIADQVDTQASKALVDHVKGRYGAIDVLFVNAGVGKFATLDRADEVHLDSDIQYQRPRSLFHGQVSGARYPKWGLHHIHGLDRRIEGRRRHERLLGNQSGSALAGANAIPRRKLSTPPSPGWRVECPRRSRNWTNFSSP